MNSAGNPDRPPGQRKTAWLLLGLLIGFLLLAGYIGTQVVGVLYGLAAPPEPPLPPGLDVVSHTAEAHGQDTWVYATDQTVCEVIAFYVERGGVCTPGVSACGQSTATASCEGQRDFSIFVMRWQADIRADERTHLRIERQVSWTGYFPTKMPVPSTENAQSGQ